MDPGFSILVVLALTLVLAASFLVFWQLERRWTARRQWVSFQEWGRAHGFRLRGADAVESIELLIATRATVRMAVANASTTILQVESGAARWNWLVRGGIARWPDTALRPASAPTSVVDQLSMQSFPLLGPNERFVIYSADSTSARKLSSSSARALLPPDVGLILKGNSLVLDFSNRPFDTIEFERMLAVADQVAGHLGRI